MTRPTITLTHSPLGPLVTMTRHDTARAAIVGLTTPQHCAPRDLPDIVSELYRMAGAMAGRPVAESSLSARLAMSELECPGIAPWDTLTVGEWRMTMRTRAGERLTALRSDLRVEGDQTSEETEDGTNEWVTQWEVRTNEGTAVQCASKADALEEMVKRVKNESLERFDLTCMSETSLILNALGYEEHPWADFYPSDNGVDIITRKGRHSFKVDEDIALIWEAGAKHLDIFPVISEENKERAVLKFANLANQ